MSDPFDIFQVEAKGGVLWREAAASLEEAKARVQELAVRTPGEYLIMSLKTGQKLVMAPEASSSSRSNAAPARPSEPPRDCQ